MKKQFKTYKEIQDTYVPNTRRNIDYYDGEDVCVIHLKFGNAWKNSTGLKLENNLTQEFIDLYREYFRTNGKGVFKTATDVVNYVVENDLPVIFYANFTDEELGIEEVYEWLEVNDHKEKEIRGE